MGWKWGFAVAGVVALAAAGVWLALQDRDRQSFPVSEPPVSSPMDVPEESPTEVGEKGEADEEGGEFQAAEVSGPGRIEVQVILDPGVDIGDAPVRLCGFEALGWNRFGPARHWTQPMDDRQRAVFESLPYGEYVAMVETDNALGVGRGSIRPVETSQTLPIRVGFSGHISGVVIGDAGAPVAGAEIRHQISNAFYRLQSVATAVRSGASGEFSIAVSAATTAQALRATAEGFAPLSTDPIPVGTKDAVLQLGAGGSASGIVVLDKSDEPAPGVALRVTSEYEEEDQAFVSDAEGRFYLTKLSPGEKQILSDDPTLSVKWRRVRFPVMAGEETQDIEVRVLACGAMSGRAYSVETGEGIPGVTITLGRGSISTITGEDGRYLFDNLPEGLYRVDYPDTPGYDLVCDPPVIPWGSYTSATVISGETTEGIDFPFSSIALSGFQISGRVVDHRGTPLAGARLRGTYGGTEAVSGPDGRFVLAIEKGFMPGDEVTAELEGYVMTPIDVFEKDLRSGVPVEVKMYPPCSIEGVAVDQFNQPLDSIAFLLTRSDRVDLNLDKFIDNGSSVVTGTGGGFAIENMVPAMYRVTNAEDIGGGGRTTMTPTPRTIALSPGEHLANARILFKESENPKEDPKDVVGQIGGRVTDVVGNPIANAKVSSKDAVTNAVTDREGYYLLDVTAELVTVHASHPDYKTGGLTRIPVGKMDVDFGLSLLDFVTVTGRVLDANTRSPITAFDLSMIPAIEGKPGYTFVRDADGVFRFERLPQTSLVIVDVYADGYRHTRAEVRGIPPDQSVVEIEILMRRMVQTEGIVRTTSGAPVSGAEVFVVDGMSGATLADARTDREGRFRLLGAGEGMQEIHVRADGYSLFRREVPILIGGGGLIQVTLWRGGVLEIHATLDGNPAGNANIDLEVHADSGDDYVFDRVSRGHFSWEEAYPGQYLATAIVELPDGGIVRNTASFRVESGQMTEVEIPLRSENAVAVR